MFASPLSFVNEGKDKATNDHVILNDPALLLNDASLSSFGFSNFVGDNLGANPNVHLTDKANKWIALITSKVFSPLLHCTLHYVQALINHYDDEIRKTIEWVIAHHERTLSTLKAFSKNALTVVTS